MQGSKRFESMKRLGVEALSRGDFDAAYQHLTEAHEVSRSDHGLLVALGWATLRRQPGVLRNRRRARERFQEALELEPFSRDALLGLGFVCRLDGDLTTASQCYRCALASLQAPVPPRDGISVQLRGTFRRAVWDKVRRAAG